MTTNNYTDLTNEELMSEIKKYDTGSSQLNNIIEHQNKELHNELMSRTKFLDDAKLKHPIWIDIRLYSLEHHLTEIPICSNPSCNNHVHWNKRQHKFSSYCCQRCKYTDKNNKDTIRQENEKREQTNIDRFGSTHPMHLKEFKQKQIAAFVSNLGVDNPMKNELSKEKREQTCIETYGGIGFASKDIYNKHSQTLLNSIGVDNWAKLESSKKVLSERIHSQEIIQKIKNTNRIRFGMDWFQQTNDHHKNKKHRFESIKYPGTTFASTWEVKVYEFCKDNGLDVECQPDCGFKYEVDGEVHTYHPDFRINDKIYEVKGDQYFRTNPITGQEEMFCPYRKGLTQEEYEYKCKLSEAKHQCMIQNQVIILRRNDIKNLSISTFTSIC